MITTLASLVPAPSERAGKIAFDPECLEGLELWERRQVSRTVPAAQTAAEEERFPENEEFGYYLIRKAGSRPEAGDERLVILLHGLNERSWGKYLPWARRVALESGSTVALFPLAFHMGRTPFEFGERERVFGVYRERKAAQGPEGESSWANAMLSARLEDRPYRFFTSGLQSFRDVADLARSVRSGRHPDFPRGAGIDFLGYSIGAFLAEILLMADPEGLFSESRLFAFCGGAVMESARARSRAILDGRAERALSGLFRSLSRGDWSSEGGDGVVAEEEWNCFVSMLGKGRLSALREKRLAEIGDRISCIALARDEVFPAEGIVDTLGSRVRVLDFPYAYRHETPFPTAGAEPASVDRALDLVFGAAARFLGKAS